MLMPDHPALQGPDIITGKQISTQPGIRLDAYEAIVKAQAEGRIAGVLLDVGLRPPPPAPLPSETEGPFSPQGWKAGRALNGDERLSLVPTDRIGAIRIKLLNRE